jgi:hypothetical protein
MAYAISLIRLIIQLSLGDFYKTLRIPKATWDISYADNQAWDEKKSEIKDRVLPDLSMQ